MKTRVILSLLFLLSFGSVRAADLFIEAESFSNKGGWKVDQQFMDLMGSPYLLAHGMGVPVDDASTEVTFPEKGEYYVYVRTYNWTSPWKFVCRRKEDDFSIGSGGFCLDVADSWKSICQESENCNQAA